MELTNIFRLIVWICIVLWMFFYVNIQLDRFNPPLFKKSKSEVLKNMEKSVGILRFFGIILYSPYFMPIRALIFWLIFVIAMLIL